MEQSNQPIVGRPVPPTVQPPVHKDHKVLFLLLGLVILLVIVGGAWAYVQKIGVPAPITKNEAPPKPEETPTVGLITYKSIATPSIIRTVQLTGDITIRVYNVGTINSGEFAGKTLALALYEFKSTRYPESGTGYYAYYIAEADGQTVAWDRNFLHLNDYCDDEWCSDVYFTDVMDFFASMQKYLGFLPEEFSNGIEVTLADHKTKVTVATNSLLPAEAVLSAATLAGLTESGFQIFKDTSSSSSLFLSPENYFVALPFGKYIKISPEPDFIDQHDVPKLNWTSGTKLVASYRYGDYAYGWQDCYNGISTAQLPVALIETGKTVNGDPVYEVDATKYPNVYKCLHEKTKRYIYSPISADGTYQETISYADFIHTHPMFFWKHSLGDWIAFLRSDVVPAAEKAKPVVYLYPEKTERINVQVKPIGGFTKTDPEYGNGWTVDATPEGVLTNTKDGKKYPYLFWEGGKEGVVETPKQGFVVAKADVASSLEDKLTQFGLNKQERADFLEFWAPKLSQAPYYFITFISRSEIDRVSPMTISPKPNTVIRVLMDYKPLEKAISVESLKITPTERKGFTVVEWGGIVR